MFRGKLLCNLAKQLSGNTEKPVEPSDLGEHNNILTSNHEYTTEAGNNNDNSSTEPYLEADLNKELSTPPCNDAMYIQFTNEDKEPLQENHEAGNNNDNNYSTEPYLEADLNKELSTPPCNDAMYNQCTNEDKEPLQENHGNDALSLPQLNNLAENIFEIRVTKYMGSKSMSSKIL